MRVAQSAVPALPLLEYSLDEIRQVEDQLPVEAQIKDILHAAMISPSGHWASSALEWLIHGFPIDDEIRDWFKGCKENKRIPQGTRQSAYSVFKKQYNKTDHPTDI